MNDMTTKDTIGQAIERVLIQGDLSRLTPDERSEYYFKVCKSVGLNPLTQPFAYITLNGRLVLYALRSCTDQLRSMHEVSVDELVETEREGVFVVTARVHNRSGRTDIAKGAVHIGGLKGEHLANALMKAETKAKRRATLSICGLGILDEAELDGLPPPPPPEIAPNPIKPAAGKITDAADKPARMVPIVIPLGDDAQAWMRWSQNYTKAMRQCSSFDEVESWRNANIELLEQMTREAPKLMSRMNAELDRIYATLKEAGAEPQPKVLRR